MPKKGNPADYNSSIFSPRMPPLRPKLFKEKRLQLYDIIKDAEKGRNGLIPLPMFTEFLPK